MATILIQNELVASAVVMWSANLANEKSAALTVYDIGTANIIAEDSNDNAAWTTIAGFATITAKGRYQVPVTIGRPYVRFRVSSWTSGFINFAVDYTTDGLNFAKPRLLAQTLTATGTTAADAAPITASKVRLTNVAASTGVRLPLGNFDGEEIRVSNAGSNTLTVYAPDGSFINAGASTTIATTVGRSFIWDAATRVWFLHY